jgi:CHASE2 domain-containing sensor protein
MRNRRYWEKWCHGWHFCRCSLPQLEVLQGFELRALSFLTYERGERIPHDDIVLVTVDDQTVAELGSPLPRRYYASLIRALNQYGAKAIVFDFFFQERRDPKMDDSLALFSKKFNNVIHAFNVKIWSDS